MLIENMLPGISRVAVPLVDNPLQATNSYIIKGQKRNLVVDTGMDREECKNALLTAFNELKIEIEQTDFFITHIHVDHLELVFKIASPGSRVFFNRPDAAILYDQGSWDSSISFAARNGFPRNELQVMVRAFRKSVFNLTNDVEFTLLQEGDIIDVGEYEFTCLETPGHTPGSMCLYESGKRFLFSGDHILEEITPNISLLMERELNPLESYLESLDKIFALDLATIFPGHRGVIKAPKQRIRELKNHHVQREREVLTILDEGPLNAYQIASRMSWEVPFEHWNEYPAFQRWFATGEALAHLKYLESKGTVRIVEKDGKIYFSSF